MSSEAHTESASSNKLPSHLNIFIGLSNGQSSLPREIPQLTAKQNIAVVVMNASKTAAVARQSRRLDSGLIMACAIPIATVGYHASRNKFFPIRRRNSTQSAREKFIATSYLSRPIYSPRFSVSEKLPDRTMAGDVAQR